VPGRPSPPKCSDGIGSTGKQHFLLTLCLLYYSRGVLSGSLLEVFHLACILLETLFTAVVGSLILSVNRSLHTMEMVVN